MILAYMPWHGAIKTSLLAREWRYRWKEVPLLIFAHQIACSFDAKLTRSLHSTFRGYHGPINKVGFLIRKDGRRIKNIMHLRPLMKTPELTDYHLHYKLKNNVVTPHLYYFDNLVHLYLFRCVFNPPPQFTGFRRLITLNFQRVKFTTEALVEFTSVCPHIESITIVNCEWLGTFEFNVPCLKFLKCTGHFKRISFTGTPLLSEVSLWADNGDFKEFQFVPTLRILHLRGHMLKVLDPRVRCQLPLCLSSLRVLDLGKGAIKPRTDYAIGDFIEFLRKQKKPDYTLNHIRNVVIEGLSGTESQLEFGRFLLLSANGLQQIDINLTAHAPTTLVDQLSWLPCARPRRQMNVDKRWF